MKNRSNKKPILLVGAGQMALAYAKALQAEKTPYTVIGRSKSSAQSFTKQGGGPVLTGGVLKALPLLSSHNKKAIVAVDIAELAPASMHLIQNGFRQLLVEKPAGVDAQEIGKLARMAKNHRAAVFVAYNRRFYASTLRAREMIHQDGGVSSFHFEFTEWSDRIAKTPHSPKIKKQWFLANSSHVIDMAFFLGGQPTQLKAFTHGRLRWHPKASAFAGAGKTAAGALFSYKADWDAPGRWGVEIMTRKRRLYLCPLEGLRVQHRDTIEQIPIALKDKADLKFKPGILLQTRAFLGGKDKKDLLTLEDHLRTVKTTYSTMCSNRSSS